MFIRLRIKAHDALKKIMLDGDHAPLFDHTTRLIYDTIKAAETDECFANELDCECAYIFDEQTADGYYDFLSLFSDIPDSLGELLSRYGIIEEED